MKNTRSRMLRALRFLRGNHGGRAQGGSGGAPGAGAPAQLAITTQPNDADSGVVFPSQPVVEIRDSDGVVVTSSVLDVTASIETGGGTLLGTVTIPAVAGVATFTDLYIAGAGAFQLIFTAAGVTGALADSLTITQVPTALGMVTQPVGTSSAAGVPDHPSIATQPSGAVDGVAFTTQPVIDIDDVFGDVATGATNNVTASIDVGTGTLGGTTVVAAVAGVAAFTNLKITGAGVNTIKFTVTGVTPTVTSNSVTVSGGGGTTYFSDNFESGLSYVSSGYGWTNDGNSDLGYAPDVSTDRAYGGSFSCKFPFKAVPDYSDDSSELRFRFSVPLMEVYIRFRIWIPANYVHRLQPGDSINNKFIILWAGDDYNASGPTVTKQGMEIERVDATHDYGALKRRYASTPDVNYGEIAQVANFITASDYGTWMNLEFYFRFDDGTSNARTKVAKNGVQVGDTGNFKGYDGQGAPIGFKRGYILGYSNSGYIEETDFYIDNVVFADFGVDLSSGTAPVSYDADLHDSFWSVDWTSFANTAALTSAGYSLFNSHAATTIDAPTGVKIAWVDDGNLGPSVDAQGGWEKGGLTPPSGVLVHHFRYQRRWPVGFDFAGYDSAKKEFIAFRAGISDLPSGKWSLNVNPSVTDTPDAESAGARSGLRWNFNSEPASTGFSPSSAQPGGANTANYGQHLNFGIVDPASLADGADHLIALDVTAESAMDVGDGKVYLWAQTGGTWYQAIARDGTNPADPFYHKVYTRTAKGFDLFQGCDTFNRGSTANQNEWWTGTGRAFTDKP